MNPDEFDSLDIEQQIKVFAQSPISEKGDLILRSHEPDKLTRSLASEELYLIMKEMDTDERAELVKYANLDQLFFISDIDCWNKDRINTASFIQWLETLQRADEKRLFAWLMSMDYETIVAGLQKFVRVLKPEWEYAADELLGDEPYFTLDRFYYIIVDEENLETVQRAFELLFENHRGRYTAIVEGILSEVEDIVEDEAYYRREGRLSERGFPDFETAMKVYAPLDRKGFEEFELKKKEYVKTPGEASSGNPNYLVLWQLQPLFLDKVLPALGEKDPEALEGAYEELAWLCNKLVVCHGMDFTSEGKVRWNVERARSLLSLGLELLSEGDIARASEILRTRWLETVFRFSVGQLYALRDDMQRIVREYWKSDIKILLEFLEPPYEFIARGLLERIPLAYDFNQTDNVYHLREFQSPEDLRRARLSVLQLKQIHVFLKEKSGSGFEDLRKAVSLGESTKTFTSVLGTLFARFAISGEPEMSPLDPEELRRFLTQAFESRGSARVIREDVKDRFWNGFFSGEERDLLTPLWGIVFQKIQEQMGRMNAEGEIETYLLTCLLVSEAPAGKKPQKKKKA